jgi:hypothetical protein
MISLPLKWESDPEFPGRKVLAGPDCISIGGAPMHAHAFAVKRDEFGCQVACNPDFQEEVDQIQTMAEGSVCTTQLFGITRGEWIVVLFPHQD